MALHFAIIDSTVHLSINLHKKTLKNFNKLQRHNQADRNKCAIQDKIRSKSNTCHLTTVCLGLSDNILKIYEIQTP